MINSSIKAKMENKRYLMLSKAVSFLYRHVYWTIFIFLSLLTLLFLFLIRKLDSHSTIREVCINLTAGMIISLLTIFGIDALQKGHKEMKLRESKDVAKDDIVRLKNMLISHMVAPFKISIYDHERNNQNLETWPEQASDNMLNDILEKDISKLLLDMSKADWRHLELNLISIKQSISENVQIYGEILPPELLGKLLKIRQPFNSFHSIFGTFSWLFTEDENQWLQNKYGVSESRSIRSLLINYFANHLKTYFIDLREFVISIKKWQNGE